MAAIASVADKVLCLSNSEKKAALFISTMFVIVVMAMVPIITLASWKIWSKIGLQNAFSAAPESKYAFMSSPRLERDTTVVQ